MIMVMKNIIWFMTNDYGHEQNFALRDHLSWSWNIKFCYGVLTLEPHLLVHDLE